MIFFFLRYYIYYILYISLQACESNQFIRKLSHFIMALFSISLFRIINPSPSMLDMKPKLNFSEKHHKTHLCLWGQTRYSHWFSNYNQDHTYISFMKLMAPSSYAFVFLSPLSGLSQQLTWWHSLNLRQLRTDRTYIHHVLSVSQRLRAHASLYNEQQQADLRFRPVERTAATYPP